MLRMFQVIRIADARGLAEFAPEWSDLVDRSPNATPFARPEWMLPWWERFGSGELHGLAVRADGRLVGWVAFFIHEWESRRQSTLVGNGITDYLGLVAEPGFEHQAAQEAFRYLVGIRDRWDLCDWQDLSCDSPLLSGIPPDLSAERESSLPCTRIALPSDAELWESSLPHGLRRTIRIAVRRLERDAELRFDTSRESGDSSALTELFRLHETRWATKGGPGSMLDQPAVQRFLIDAAARFAAIGKLRLYTLRVNGELEGVILALLDRGRAWGYITGMNPALGRFSPGSLVLHYAIGEAIKEGAVAWEFLRGDEEYKFLWGAQKVPKVRLCIRHWQSGDTVREIGASHYRGTTRFVSGPLSDDPGGGPPARH